MIDPNQIAQNEIKMTLGDLIMQLAFTKGQLAAAEERLKAAEAETKPNGKDTVNGQPHARSDPADAARPGSNTA